MSLSPLQRSRKWQLIPRTSPGQTSDYREQECPTLNGVCTYHTHPSTTRGSSRRQGRKVREPGILGKSKEMVFSGYIRAAYMNSQRLWQHPQDPVPQAKQICSRGSGKEGPALAEELLASGDIWVKDSHFGDCSHSGQAPTPQSTATEKRIRELWEEEKDPKLGGEGNQVERGNLGGVKMEE